MFEEFYGFLDSRFQLLSCLREDARKRIPFFIEAYLECLLEICIRRERRRTNTHQAPRQIYDRALESKASTVPSLGQPYEPPIDSEIAIDVTKYTPEECANKILKVIRSTFSGA